jgi:putative protease
LSLEEIKPIASYLKSQNVGCEIFVHGAYCISYSGQCYLSGDLYGLKGNRGACVQPCRRQYSLSKDSFKTQEPFAPFNLKDNCAFPLLKELIAAGATSLKIEGRIKSPEYVFAVTQAYREQIDRIYQNQKTIENDSRLDFSMNRSFSTGYLEGKIHKSMFTYGHKDHSLVYAGQVFSYFADKGILSLNLETSENLNSGFLITILKKDKTFVTTGIIQEKISNNEYKIKLTGKLAEKIKGGDEVYFTKELISKEELSSLTSKLKPSFKNIVAFVEGKKALL